MNIVDLLVTIVVVTILVTIVLAIVTYIAYKFRLSREPEGNAEAEGALRYFVRYDPPSPEGGQGIERLVAVTGAERHETQT